MNKLVDRYMDTMPDSFVGPDPLELEVDVLRGRVATLEENVKQMALNNLSILQRMATLQARFDEQSTAAPQSAIILPGRFN